MKARLLPLYFESFQNNEFNDQVRILQELLVNEAEFLEPVALGSNLPEADAVVFPVLIGEAYKQIGTIKEISIPIIALTSEFGTVAMWDWEIITFLKAHSVETFAPYELELTKIICRALALKQELKSTKFLVFQDNPGDGMQAEIFKRFYWWEETCTELIKEKFGVQIVKKSFKKLGEEAKSLSDAEGKKVLDNWNIHAEGLSERSLLSTAKLYIAIKKELDRDVAIKGVGINCLNESFYSDTTPCLAWNMLYEEAGITWACEADTVALATQYLINKSLGAPVMTSNLYPFLMGMAALKHEKIDKFPVILEPENCILVAHCGYMGLVPQSMSSQWTLRPKVLQIVDDNAITIDARMPDGAVTLAKLHSDFNKIMLIEGNLEGYAQYPGSDCRNGAVIRVQDGRKLMENLYSHHSCIMTGHKRVELEIVAKVFDLQNEGI